MNLSVCVDLDLDLFVSTYYSEDELYVLDVCACVYVWVRVCVRYSPRTLF